MWEKIEIIPLQEWEETESSWIFYSSKNEELEWNNNALNFHNHLESIKTENNTWDKIKIILENWEESIYEIVEWNNKNSEQEKWFFLKEEWKNEELILHSSNKWLKLDKTNLDIYEDILWFTGKKIKEIKRV